LSTTGIKKINIFQKLRLYPASCRHDEGNTIQRLTGCRDVLFYTVTAANASVSSTTNGSTDPIYFLAPE
jgi:hypothetical protein